MPGPPVAPLTIVTDTLVAGEVGLPYHDTLQATGAEPPVAWSIADAGLDVTSWLKLDQGTGALTGTPTKAFDWEAVLIGLSDSADGGRAIQKSVQLRVDTCDNGATRPCAFASGGSCMTGQMTCSNGAWPTNPSACVNAVKSRDKSQCGSACGDCGAAGDSCNGTCTCGSGAACGPGSTCCPGTNSFCTNLQNGDVNNCGACGHRCLPAPGQNNVAASACSNGKCVFQCNNPGSFLDCNSGTNGNDGDGCETDITRDPTHCGSCATNCTTLPNTNHTAQCISSICHPETACLSRFIHLSSNPSVGCEIDTNSDPNHCGSPTQVNCATLPNTNGTAQCVAGICRPETACNPGWGHYSSNPSQGCEVDTTKTAIHCGPGGPNSPNNVNCTTLPHVDPNKVSCTNGLCQLTNACLSPYAHYTNNLTDGCETDTSQNPQHCGSTNIDCTTRPFTNGKGVCRNSLCDVTGTCVSGRADCNSFGNDGCEVDLTSDVNNCNGCSIRCGLAPHAASMKCQNSTCALNTCASGWCDLDGNPGCETPLGTDLACSSCSDNCRAQGYSCFLGEGCAEIPAG